MFFYINAFSFGLRSYGAGVTKRCSKKAEDIVADHFRTRPTKRTGRLELLDQEPNQVLSFAGRLP